MELTSELRLPVSENWLPLRDKEFPDEVMKFPELTFDVAVILRLRLPPEFTEAS